MEPRLRKITLIVLSVLIVIVISFGVTKAFMKPVEQGGNLTEIALSSCAKIKLTGTSSINLSNSYPMSRNRGLQTTPYSLTVTSYCDTYVGFNLYIATLSSNTLDASKIHYILTDKGSKNATVEGVLSTADNGVADFSDTEKTELNTGLKGTYGSIYKIHNANIALKGNKQYDLYLFVDEAVTNDTMGQTFKAGVAVKSYDREKDKTLAEYVIEQYAGVQGNNNIYHHDGTLENGINDGSYRYSGASEDVNNYVCFGTSESPCPTDNLYRIMGVIDNQLKLIKYDYANSNLLGTDGDYNRSGVPNASTYKGSLTTISKYYWNGSTYKNTWSESNLNKINLNINYINNIGAIWANKIATTTWKVGGNTTANINYAVPATTYQNEVVNPVTTNTTDNATTYSAKIGLMYVSDYGYAASPEAWTLTMDSYNNTTATNNNWMYMGIFDWVITRSVSDSEYVFNIGTEGYADINGVYNYGAVRPVFFLESSVTYASGEGTMNNPIVLGD